MGLHSHIRVRGDPVRTHRWLVPGRRMRQPGSGVAALRVYHRGWNPDEERTTKEERQKKVSGAAH